MNALKIEFPFHYAPLTQTWTTTDRTAPVYVQILQASKLITYIEHGKVKNEQLDSQ